MGDYYYCFFGGVCFWRRVLLQNVNVLKTKVYQNMKPITELFYRRFIHYNVLLSSAGEIVNAVDFNG